MKTFWAAVAVSVAFPAAADTLDPFTDFYVFGDSLSDSGNVAILAQIVDGFEFDYTSYPLGQFTNGNTWATQLGLSPSLAGGTNYAYGGARASDNLDLIPDLSAQVDQFESDNRVLGDNALASIYIGGNDFRDFFAPALNGGPLPSSEETFMFVSGLIGDISQGVTDLASAGFQEIVVFGFPDLGKIPALVDTAFGDLATATIEHANEALQSSVFALNAWLAGVNATYFGTSSLFDDILAANNPYGFENTDTACLSVPTECDPSAFVFWDSIHPTDAVHRLIAEEFVGQISEVPLPAGFSLLIGGLALLGLARRRVTSHA